MNPEMFGEVARMLGRVEAKVDKIDEKQDNHAILLAEYGVRLAAVEKAHNDQRAKRAADKMQEKTDRLQIRTAVITGVLGFITGVSGSLVSLIHG